MFSISDRIDVHCSSRNASSDLQLFMQSEFQRGSNLCMRSLRPLTTTADSSLRESTNSAVDSRRNENENHGSVTPSGAPDASATAPCKSHCSLQASCPRVWLSISSLNSCCVC